MSIERGQKGDLKQTKLNSNIGRFFYFFFFFRGIMTQMILKQKEKDKKQNKTERIVDKMDCFYSKHKRESGKISKTKKNKTTGKAFFLKNH